MAVSHIAAPIIDFAAAIRPVIYLLRFIYIFIHQTGSKNNKTNKYSNLKTRKT